MSQKNNVKFFLHMLNKYIAEFNLKDVEIIQDNRLGKRYICKTTFYSWCDSGENFPVIVYNTKLILKANRCELIQIILHELAHIKFGHIYSTEQDRLLEFEYDAELFSYEYIRLNEPKLLAPATNNLRSMSTNGSKVYSDIAKMILKKYDCEV